MKRTRIFVLLIGMLTCHVYVLAEGPPSLRDVAKVMQSKQFVDLTHAFHPGIPHWPGFDNEQRVTT